MSYHNTTEALEIHPLADLFPHMSEEEFLALKSDISAQGLLDPIITHENKVIDGRHRYRACQELGVAPRFEAYEGNAPIAYVISKNLHRRHLNSSQKAVIALELEKELAKAAEQRKLATLNHSSVDREKIPYREKGKASEQAAKQLGTNPRYVSDAKKLRNEAPALLDQVRQGAINIPDAIELAKENPEKAQAIIKEAKEKQVPVRVVQKELAKAAEREKRVSRVIESAASTPSLDTLSERYPVLYVDPPWQYEHSQSDSRSIEAHYPSMSIEDICALPVGNLAANDAVLFLWATSPKLVEGLKVIESWGFTYRTCAVWVKNKIGMGYYFRQRHELLLVATRGDIPTPAPAARMDSVLQYPRHNHSEKPHEIYEIIEGMYPEYAKIELFSRNLREGWKGWGFDYEQQ